MAKDTEDPGREDPGREDPGREDPEVRGDPLSRYFEAAMGLTELTRRRAERIVRHVVKQGGSAGNPKELVENLLERSSENREALVALVRGETERAMKAMGLATRNDVERLEQQLRALRRQLAEAEGSPRMSEAAQRAEGTAEAPARAASKTTAKEAAQGTARKETGQ